MEMKLKVREKKKVILYIILLCKIEIIAINNAKLTYFVFQWNWRWCVLRKTHTIGIGKLKS